MIVSRPSPDRPASIRQYGTLKQISNTIILLYVFHTKCLASKWEKITEGLKVDHDKDYLLVLFVERHHWLLI